MALVVSKRSAKTIKVALRRKMVHRKYKWVRMTNSFFLVHDEFEQCVPGDQVIIRQCAPVSRLKRHCVHEIAVRYRPEAFLERNPDLRPSDARGADGGRQGFSRLAEIIAKYKDASI